MWIRQTWSVFCGTCHCLYVLRDISFIHLGDIPFMQMSLIWYESDNMPSYLQSILVILTESSLFLLLLSSSVYYIFSIALSIFTLGLPSVQHLRNNEGSLNHGQAMLKLWIALLHLEAIFFNHMHEPFTLFQLPCGTSYYWLCYKNWLL